MSAITMKRMWLAVPLAVFFGLAVSASADTTYDITIAAAAGTASTCKAGNTGTFETFTDGGVLLEAPSGSTSGCYVGNYSGTPGAPTPNGAETSFISGLTGEGTATGLNSLATGYYAEFGAICGGPGQCTASNNSSNGAGSGDIDVLVNSGSTSQTFSIYNTGGTKDSAGNTAPTGCTYSGTTFTVAADTICFEDLSTGGSIAMTIGTPAVPEPANVGIASLGVLGIAELLRRRRLKKA